MTAFILCLALAAIVSLDITMVLKPRVRRPAATANPGGAPPVRAGAPLARTRTDLVALRPVNGVYRGTQPRDTPHVTVNGPVVPRWFQVWEQGRWAP